uniref:Transposase (Putative), gypsy type n=1 Tax=Tanacetum cinerariifolium TaxID=118510 RepID=A0A6L2K0Z1_TANCI|nr:hypothetical protein [Tanacetum cinerariifolium]
MIGERERNEDEPKLLETIIGRVVSLLPVDPDRSSGKLEANVDKLSDEGGSGEQADQGDSASGGHGVGVQPVNVIAEVVVKDVAPTELQRKKKHKTKIVDVAGDNLHTLEAPQRFVISSDSSDHSSANITKAEVDSIVRTFVPIMTSTTNATPAADPAATANERLIGSSLFGGDSSSAGGSHPISGGFSDRTGSDFFVGARQICLSAEVRMRVEYNIKEKRRLKSVVEEKDVLLKSRCDEIENLKAQLIVKEAEAAEAVHLRDETKTLKECNIILEKEKSKLEVKVTDLAASVKVREQEITDLDVVVTSVKLQNDSLVDQVHELEVASSGFQEKLSHYENLTERLEEFHDAQLKCLHSSEYLSALGAAIRKAIEKGMQDGLAAEITHGVEGRTLADVAAYNPFAEADYVSALQRLQNINFSLLVELRSSKDASVDTIMNILRLEDNLAERLDDHEIAHTEGGEDAVADVEAVADDGADPFPDVSGVELDVPE